MSVAHDRRSAAEEKWRRPLDTMFARADVQLNGERPFDIQVHNPLFYRRVMRDGVMGLGEAYVDGWWDCDRVDELTRRFVSANLQKAAAQNLTFLLYALRVRLSGIGRRGKAFEVGHRHYDLGNDLFKAMLDPLMVYSCAYWKDADNLEQAQHNKLDLICRKLALQPGQRVLDIGCGWGGWAKYAAETYGVQVVGLTVSKQQLSYAQAKCAGLPVEFRLQDYREAEGTYDRVVSIAMFEAVGHAYYQTFMEVVDKRLAADGLFLLHSIVGNEPVSAQRGSWLNEYIFPNGELPALSQITAAAEGFFVVEAAHRFTDDYDRTLAAWDENFLCRWPELREAYGESFFRMWRFYLQMSRGLFQSRMIQVWQLVFSKNGAPMQRSYDPRAYLAAIESR
jgi:cyclopropane-fatty-acyl-phospholipid synthase